MPLTGDAKKVMASMVEQYGPKKGKQVFYATANKQKRDERTWKKAGLPAADEIANDDEATGQKTWALPGALIGAGLGLATDAAVYATDPTIMAGHPRAPFQFVAVPAMAGGLIGRFIKRSEFVPAKLACGLSETPKGKRLLELAKQRDPDSFERNLQAGMTVEKEHGTEKAEQTALDHMVENPAYYDEYEKVKEKLEGKAAAATPASPVFLPRTPVLPLGRHTALSAVDLPGQIRFTREQQQRASWNPVKPGSPHEATERIVKTNSMSAGILAALPGALSSDIGFRHGLEAVAQEQVPDLAREYPKFLPALATTITRKQVWPNSFLATLGGTAGGVLGAYTGYELGDLPGAAAGALGVGIPVGYGLGRMMGRRRMTNFLSSPEENPLWPAASVDVIKQSAVESLVQTTAQDAPPRGDENHIPLVENPYAGTPNAPEYENGYQYAQTLGHQTLNQLSPAQVASWKTTPVAWRTGFADAAEKLGVKTISDQLRAGGPMKAANWSWTKLAESEDEDEDKKEDEDEDDEDEDDKKKKSVLWNFSKEAKAFRLPNLHPEQIARNLQEVTKPINVVVPRAASAPSADQSKRIKKEPTAEWNWQKTSGILNALKPLAGAGIGAMIPPLVGAGLGAGIGELAHMSMDPLYANSMGTPHAEGPTDAQIQHTNQMLANLHEQQNAINELVPGHNIHVPGTPIPEPLASNTPSGWNIFTHHQPGERLNWEVPVGALAGLGAGATLIPHGALIGGSIGALSSLAPARPRNRDLMPL